MTGSYGTCASYGCLQKHRSIAGAAREARWRTEGGRSSAGAKERREGKKKKKKKGVGGGWSQRERGEQRKAWTEEQEDRRGMEEQGAARGLEDEGRGGRRLRAEGHRHHVIAVTHAGPREVVAAAGLEKLVLYAL